jgi:hypothetical protein
LRAQHRKLQESLIAANSAAEEHAAELAQGPERRSATIRSARWPQAATAPMRMRASICRAEVAAQVE